VFKGMRMAGHMGNERVTVTNLRVVQVDAERHLLALQGAVPGGRNGLLIIRKSRGTP
jgi:large subunit ribosomal protein L3